ncbi:PTS glucitol/sorbitol transporter subunit IIB [Catenisphaera adipataccumulans]|jgi:PTS system glucitol/sorbitol-specific IIB component|uniref:PTS system glucitol/sorbitol-specific IIC component n=1 Tax=Catenisphaera adipataccumulans TaxID=700500 RepID=A0A7W8CVU3_9FIRM|nr:PTS glucitol/sorbitol transporter subunit IIB [Catenisphaera adipataccumulans]MBB5182547.1 PTS system glucitol/sorbitol-specific IIC component [Catenisphaera adipataccumulans]
MAYRNIKITKGSAGFGGPLIIEPTETRNKVLCVTGQTISPVAKKIAEMTGCELVDGFKTNVPDEQVAVAVVNCGGTARCGVYPRKHIMTVNVEPVGAVGPLAQYITEDIYVSDVSEENLSYTDETNASAAKSAAEELEAADAAGDNGPKTKDQAKADVAAAQEGQKQNLVTRIGVGVGHVVNKFFAAGRDSIDMVIRNILPFMAFTSTLLGIISASGLGNVIANTISPFCSTLPGMIFISFICGLPFLSPILGPGAVIAQVVGTLLGAEFAKGNIPAQYALPALFAIDAQVGCDFIPVGLSLGEAEPDTIEMGVPAVLYSRVITGPLAVVIAYFFSMGLY